MHHYCQQASRLASDRLERDLSLGEHLHLWLHLAMCRLCRSNTRAMGKMHCLLHSRKGASDSMQLDKEQRRHIEEMLRRQK